jgi:VWFA-related protein
MRSRCSILLAAVVLGAQPASQAQRPTFRSGVSVVSVDVSVRRGGAPVPNLRSSDFVLTDNGVPQTIDAVAIEAIPIDVSLVLDISLSASGAIGRVRSDSRKIAGMLRPDDRLRLVTFSADIDEALPLQSPVDPLTLGEIRAAGGTSLNDAMLLALAQPIPPDRRHLVVVFTDGEDTTSTLGEDMVPEIAGRADAVLHAVLFKPTVPLIVRHMDANEPPAPPPASRAALVEAAARTGGDTHRLDDAVTAFRAILDDFRQSYVLRYTPTGVPRSGWHTLDVRVARPDGPYTLRARKGYAGSE